VLVLCCCHRSWRNFIIRERGNLGLRHCVCHR
jgi:hypothetical protein